VGPAKGQAKKQSGLRDAEHNALILSVTQKRSQAAPIPPWPHPDFGDIVFS
jgi:hypothetical protein